MHGDSSEAGSALICSRSGATSIRVRVRWERSVTRPSGRGTGGGCWD